MVRKTANLRKEFVKLVNRINESTSTHNLAILGQTSIRPEFRTTMKKVLMGADESLREKVYAEFGKDAISDLNNLKKDPKTITRPVLVKTLATMEPFKGGVVI